MKPHPKLRKTIKWSGAAVTVLLVVVWIASTRWEVVLLAVPPCWTIGFNRGSLIVAKMPFPKVQLLIQPSASGFADLDWWFHSEHGRSASIVWIPLWILVLIAASPMAIAWRCDRLARRRAGLNLCPKCGYDRAGIAGDAKCPECGTLSQP